MSKRNIQIGIMILAVIFAVMFHREQVIDHNKETAHNYFVEYECPVYPYGIDYTRPVKLYQVKKGDVFIQYQIPNAPQGNFYAFEGSLPTELGINEIGYDEDEEIVAKKVKRFYVATKDFIVLSSYTAPMVDDWSTPEDETQTKGGKIQLFTTCKTCFKLK